MILTKKLRIFYLHTGCTMNKRQANDLIALIGRIQPLQIPAALRFGNKMLYCCIKVLRAVRRCPGLQLNSGQCLAGLAPVVTAYSTQNAKYQPIPKRPDRDLASAFPPFPAVVLQQLSGLHPNCAMPHATLFAPLRNEPCGSWRLVTLTSRLIVAA